MPPPLSDKAPDRKSAGDSWLITGAAGRLGYQLCRYLAERGDRVVGLRHGRPVGVAGVREESVDLLSAGAVARAVDRAACRNIVHAAGLTNVDECEADPASAQRIHVDATREIAAAARRTGARLVYISTDHLSDGRMPFVTEDMPPQPMNEYARTKREGELAAIEEQPAALILRTNFFGVGRPWRPSFSDWIGRALSRGDTLNMFDDVFFSPIAIDLLCPLIAEMATRGASGIYNAAGSERLSKYDFAVRYAHAFGHRADLIKSSSVSKMAFKAPRPRDMSLSTEKISRLLGRPMPGCAESLDALRQRPPDVVAATP